MKVHRFYIKQSLGEEVEIVDRNIIHQWLFVLRFASGQRVIVFSGEDEAVYQIKELNKKSCTLLKIKTNENTVDQKAEAEADDDDKVKDVRIEGLLQINEKKINLNLCFALLKKENVELVLEKCTELGVSNFIPTITERTEKKNILSFNKERSQKIIIEATEQSGWSKVPTLQNPLDLKAFLVHMREGDKLDCVYVLDIADTGRTQKENPTIPKDVYLLVGPEGGWTESERVMFRDLSIKNISFGINVLRGETACIVGSFHFLQHQN